MHSACNDAACMDDSWDSFNFAYHSSNNHEAVSHAGEGSDIASVDGMASASNVCNESASIKRERDKEYKNKSRQKQADEKVLLDLKVLPTRDGRMHPVSWAVRDDLSRAVEPDGRKILPCNDPRNHGFCTGTATARPLKRQVPGRAVDILYYKYVFLTYSFRDLSFLGPA